MEERTNNNVPHMVGLKEASARTGIPYYQLRKGCLSGQIVFIRFNSKIFINMDKLLEMLNGEVEDE